MDINAVNEFIKGFVPRYSDVFRQIQDQETKTLELAVFLGAKEHYRVSGYNTYIRNPRGGDFVVKTNSRGHPSKYSRVELEKDGNRFEIHMNLGVRSAHDEGIYCVDIGVTNYDSVPTSVSRGSKWICLDNDQLLTFAEAKKLVVYPMLLAQFVGIVHEIKPHFIGGKRRPIFTRARHFQPTLVTLGHFSGNSKKIVDAFARRKIRINIITDYDTRLAIVRRGSSSSPFESDFWGNGPKMRAKNNGHWKPMSG